METLLISPTALAYTEDILRELPAEAEIYSFSRDAAINSQDFTPLQVNIVANLNRVSSNSEFFADLSVDRNRIINELLIPAFEAEADFRQFVNDKVSDPADKKVLTDEELVAEAVNYAKACQEESRLLENKNFKKFIAQPNGSDQQGIKARLELLREKMTEFAQLDSQLMDYERNFLFMRWLSTSGNSRGLNNLPLAGQVKELRRLFAGYQFVHSSKDPQANAGKAINKMAANEDFRDFLLSQPKASYIVESYDDGRLSIVSYFDYLYDRYTSDAFEAFTKLRQAQREALAAGLAVKIRPATAAAKSLQSKQSILFTPVKEEVGEQQPEVVLEISGESTNTPQKYALPVNEAVDTTHETDQDFRELAERITIGELITSTAEINHVQTAKELTAVCRSQYPELFSSTSGDINFRLALQRFAADPSTFISRIADFRANNQALHDLVEASQTRRNYALKYGLDIKVVSKEESKGVKQ